MPLDLHSWVMTGVLARLHALRGRARAEGLHPRYWLLARHDAIALMWQLGLEVRIGTECLQIEVLTMDRDVTALLCDRVTAVVLLDPA